MKRPQLQSLGQKAVKPQAPLPLGGESEQGNLHLDHFAPPGLVKAFLNGDALLPSIAGYLLHIFLYKGNYPMHMPMKPPAAVFFHKTGKFREEFPKIIAKLPCLPRQGFLYKEKPHLYSYQITYFSQNRRSITAAWVQRKRLAGVGINRRYTSRYIKIIFYFSFFPKIRGYLTHFMIDAFL